MRRICRLRRFTSILMAMSMVLAIAAPAAAARPSQVHPDPALVISSHVPDGMPEGGAIVINTTLSGEIVSVQSDTL
jgi:hypothetical protein